MTEKQTALRAAFLPTLPVMAGYIFLGMAYGVLMSTHGFALGWTALISTVTYAGSLQFLLIPLLGGAFAPVYAFCLALMVNARHLFYGISLLKPLQTMGKKKWYMVFALTDETFSLLYAVKPKEGVNKEWFWWGICLFDQCYWVLGSIVGHLLGGYVAFDTAGLDFVMTALFVVIFLQQWETQRQHGPALIGAGVSLLCLVAFGQSAFVLPALAGILALVTVCKPKLQPGAEEEQG